MRRHLPAKASVPRGFTLIEVLVVMVIIAILVALVVPAISGVRTRARMAQVSAEISQLDAAIAKFKAVFNVEPPSSLLIPPAGGTWTALDRSKVRGLWPQFNFATNGNLGNTSAIHLNGAECLVFFLGGYEATSGTVKTVIGFSKDPRYPWDPNGTNREGPFFEFANERLVNVDGDLAFEYVDPLPGQQTPYLYLSSQGRKYLRTNTANADDFDVFGSARDLQTVYLKTATPPQEHRAGGFQIISPGQDGEYGTGGIYTNGEELTGNRAEEADNITNFSGGQLLP